MSGPDPSDVTSFLRDHDQINVVQHLLRGTQTRSLVYLSVRLPVKVIGPCFRYRERDPTRNAANPVAI